MIPKIIHYCWFGKKEKPDLIKTCIKSWEKILNDYTIMEWNETNYDITAYKYVEEAYKEQKFAFVSDVVRLDVLYEHGGIYLDADVEVFKKFDNLLNTDKCILGFEEKNYVATSFIAAPPKNSFIKYFLKTYIENSFYNNDGTLDTTTNVYKLTSILIEKGLAQNNTLQTLSNNIMVFPQEYFSPYDYINCISKQSSKSYCMHHFYVSWLPYTARLKKFLKKILFSSIGANRMDFIRKKLKENNYE